MKLSFFLRTFHRTYGRTMGISVMMEFYKGKSAVVISRAKHIGISRVLELRKFAKSNKRRNEKFTSGQAIIRCLNQGVKGYRASGTDHLSEGGS